MSNPTYKITVLQSVPLQSPKITNDTIITQGDFSLTLPGYNATLSTLAGTETLTNKTLTTPTIASILNSGATLTVPSTTGTLALVSEVNAQKDRIDRLLDYLEAFISAGNLSMSDIKSAVDPVAQQQEPEGEGEGEGQ